MANRQYTVPIEIVPSSGGGGAGTVTSVGTAGIATGGPITTTGTVTVAGSGNTTTAATAAANLAGAPANDVVTTDGSGNVKDSGTLLASLAPLASPTFTGTPAAPTAGAGTNTTQLATTAFVQAAVGASGAVVWNNIGNATGNLSLSNAAFTTTFNQTSGVAWLWANTTVATSGTTNASPLLELAANYWTGAASATDTWTLQSSLAAGTNGISTLAVNHTGSTGAQWFQLPGGDTRVGGLQFNGTLGYIGCSGGSTQITFLNGANTAVGTINGNTFPGATFAGFGIYSERNNTPTYISASYTTGQGPMIGFGNINSSLIRTAAGTQVGVDVGLSTNGSGGFTFAPTSGAANFTAFQIAPTINQTGSASGNYTACRIGITETALLGTANKFLTCQGGTTAATTKFEINNSGVVDNYNSVATVRNGIPAEYASSDLTAQTAAITATTLYATTATSAYRVSWSAAITTAASTSSVLGGTNGFQVLYTSPTDSVVKTTVAGASVTSAANTTGTATSGVLTVYAKTGTNIQFTYDYTSVGVTQMAFEIHVTVEQL